MKTNTQVEGYLQKMYTFPFIKVLKDTTDITGEVTSIGGVQTLGDEFEGLIRDQMDVAISNTEKKYDQVSFSEGYINASLGYSDFERVNYGLNEYQQGSIYQADEVESDFKIDLTCVSEGDIEQEFTIDTILKNIKPSKVLTSIFSSLGIQAPIIQQTSTGDETEKTITAISFYKENAMDTIKNLLQWSRGALVYNQAIGSGANSGRFVYYTREYLQARGSESTAIDVQFSSLPYLSANGDFSKHFLSDSRFESDRSTVKNKIRIERYSPRLNEVDLGEGVEAIGTTSTEEMLFDFYYESDLEIEIGSATTSEDGSGTDYYLLDPSTITATFSNTTAHKTDINFTNTNGVILYVQYKLKGKGYKYIKTTSSQEDTISVGKYKLQEYNISNPFFQSIPGVLAYQTNFLNANANPRLKTFVKILAHPNLELLDRISFVNNKKGHSKTGIIKQIKWNYSTTSGFTMDLELQDTYDYVDITEIEYTPAITYENNNAIETTHFSQKLMDGDYTYANEGADSDDAVGIINN